MRTKKILFCTEASFMPTGYSVYTKEVLSRLSQNPLFEVAELACYCDGTEPEVAKSPWKVFPNKPKPGSKDLDEYNKHATYQFGEYSFNSVLLEFKPDFVMDIRDWWMLEFQQRCPFRDFFNWAIMPTVDAAPQNTQWVDTYNGADAVFTYSEFGKETLVDRANISNFVSLAPPCASQTFSPVVDKKLHKDKMGLSEDAFIVGTVMRNQRRKLYPDLFSVFRDFLDSTESPDAFLYCHTYFPDVGWQIPELLQEYNLTNRVLFTYKCKSCGFLQPSFFQDVVQCCPSCNKFTNELVGIGNKISEEELAQVYNLFDIYIQYANSEGFGMPQLEAAQCGVPLVSIYYSAMQSVIDNIGAIPLEPLTFYTECETGCKRAVPDNKKAVDTLIELYNLSPENLKSIGSDIREKTISHYSWDKTAKAWSDYFESTPVRDISETWHSPPRKFQSASEIPKGLSVKDQVNFIFESVLGKPDWIGGYLWKRTLRDVLYRCCASSVNSDFYFNESHLMASDQARNTPFDIDIAYEYFFKLRKLYNDWEDIRVRELTKEFSQ
tara:strand:+ start:1470 stop:3122 length:1653 start_codon:yes stop_codon:yes gene_type:complete